MRRRRAILGGAPRDGPPTSMRSADDAEAAEPNKPQTNNIAAGCFRSLARALSDRLLFADKASLARFPVGLGGHPGSRQALTSSNQAGGQDGRGQSNDSAKAGRSH
jgi:hypothetical protein